MKILHHRADVRSTAFVLAALAVTAVQWTGLLRHPALCAAGAVLAFLACVVNHNHQHHPTFAPAALNRVFGALLSLATGQPACAIVPMHLGNHHPRNNRPDDHVRVSLVRFRWNLLNLLLFPFAALAGYARVKSGEMRAWRAAHPALYRQLVLERLALYSIVATMLAARPAETMLYAVLPWAFGQWGIIAINLIQHDGCDPESDVDHSRNYTGRWLNWWVLNNGYHTVHHLRPDLHWSLLPEAHAGFRGRIDPRLERRSLGADLVAFYVWPARRPSQPEGAA